MAVAAKRPRTAGAGRKSPQINSLHVLTSGWAEQHYEHRYGSRMPQLWWIFFARRWVKLPINYFLIDHCDGPILFDTGLDPILATHPENYISSRIGRFLLRKIFRLHMTENDRLDRKLAELGIRAGDIQKAVISHLHFDHVGGIAHIPQADLLVSEEEWSILSKPHPEHEWILKEHVQIPNAKWQTVRFEPSTDPLFEDFEGTVDVTGDGSIILLPTPGHTQGSLSMLIRSEGWAPILLVADLTYEASLLDDDILPGTGDATRLLNSYANVRKLRQKLPGLIIVPSHDFSASEAIAKATKGIEDTASFPLPHQRER